MPYFKYDNINFYYEDDDNGGKPFIFLHGLGGDTNQVLSLFKKTEGIRRIAIDFRGHGQTIEFGSVNQFSFNQFADDVFHFIKYLNLGDVYLGGISTGAGVSLNFYLRYPEYVSKLILSRPAWLDHSQEDDIKKSFETIHDILQNEHIIDKIKALEKTEIYHRLNNQSNYAGNALKGQFNYKYAKYTSQKLIKIPNDAPNWNKQDWKNINIPTLILVSKLDPIHPYNYGVILRDHINTSKMQEITSKEISSAKHDLEAYKLIKEFLLT